MTARYNPNRRKIGSDTTTVNAYSHQGMAGWICHSPRRRASADHSAQGRTSASATTMATCRCAFGSREREKFMTSESKMGRKRDLHRAPDNDQIAPEGAGRDIPVAKRQLGRHHDVDIGAFRILAATEKRILVAIFDRSQVRDAWPDAQHALAQRRRVLGHVTRNLGAR